MYPALLLKRNTQLGKHRNLLLEKNVCGFARLQNITPNVFSVIFAKTFEQWPG
jgi:hypothetical protein